MDVKTLLETMEDILERSFTIPIWGKALVDKDDLLHIIRDIRLKLPDEITQAKRIKEARDKILLEAEKKANDVIRNAENKVITMIEEHEIVKLAKQKGEEIISDAHKVAKQIQLGSKEYADEILAKVENILKEALETIRSNREELR